MRTRFELADVVKHFGAGLLAGSKLTPLQLKVLGKIAICRTAVLGGHEEICDNCGRVRYSYNSCGDRHCPKCQAAKQAFWIDDLMQSTLPVRHYHIVFTAAHQLNAICLHNQRMYYDLLFSSVWSILRSFGYSHYVVESGAVKYLGQYTHRVAITNQRILRISAGKVTFLAKDYRDGASQKPVTLDGVEFLRRFTLHILPSRFVKIRRFGIYNSTTKRNLDLKFVPVDKPEVETLISQRNATETRLERFRRISGVDPCLCPVCKTGRMVSVMEIPRIRSPDYITLISNHPVFE